jgi:hypothetical protein
MDGTRSKGLGKFLGELPGQFNDLVYGSKMLASGNRVASGALMGWVYKLKSMDNSGPLVAFIRDIIMLKEKPGSRAPFNKTVTALNYWLQNERSDLPLSITELSYLSYNNPVAEDGILPISMFGEKLNFHAMKEKNIQWLICYGEHDDLVEKEVALAPALPKRACSHSHFMVSSGIRMRFGYGIRGAELPWVGSFSPGDCGR